MPKAAQNVLAKDEDLARAPVVDASQIDSGQPGFADEYEVRVQERRTLFGSLSLQARIVYLGNKPSRSAYMLGSITEFEDEDNRPQWEPTAALATIYDFSRFDSKRRLRKDRLTQDGHIWGFCKNIEHMIAFVDLRNTDGDREFKVLAAKDVRDKIEQYKKWQDAVKRSKRDEGSNLVAEMDALGAFKG